MPRTVDSNQLNEQMGCIQKPKNFLKWFIEVPVAARRPLSFQRVMLAWKVRLAPLQSV